MSTRRWYLVAAAIAAVAAIVAIVFIWVIPDRPESDCATVHELIDFNQKHNETITAQSDPSHPSETPASDYKSWATQLKSYADEIHDPQLASHAERVAALADQTVTVVNEARDDSTQSPLSGPPPWVQEYAQLNKQFKAELATLQTACPA
jgi:anti-sigma factor RsiW